MERKFIKHIIAAVAFIIILPIIIIWALNIFTNHGESLSVPDFTGLTISEAKKLAKKKDLKIKVIDSVYNASGRRGTVINQNPQRDFKVKKDRHIFVTIKSLMPEIIKMPDFNSMTLIQAKADLETYGLKIDKLEYIPSKYDNVVLEQRFKKKIIEPGVDIEKGAKITLVLGKSENMKNVVTPMLIGLTRDDAIQKTADEFLNIGTIIYDETIISYEDSLNAKVNKQFPIQNVPTEPGEEIDIWLSMLGDTIMP